LKIKSLQTTILPFAVKQDELLDVNTPFENPPTRLKIGRIV